MELRKRKWISNNFPKYDKGKVSGQILPGATFADKTVYDYNHPQIQGLKTVAEYNKLKYPTNGNFFQNAYDNGPAIAQNAVNFLGSSINAFTLGRSTGEIMSDAGQRTVNNGMFTWQRQNEIDSGKEMSDLHKQHVNNTLATVGTGAALGGSIGGPIGAGIGAAVGGIIGFVGGGSTHAKLRKRIQNAKIQTENNNNYNFASAQGEWLNQQYDLNHAYTQDGQIYVAKYGKACGGLMKHK